MEFDLEYKLQQFRDEQPELFDKNGERYTATPISKNNGEMMLQLINELESALAKAETEIRQLTIPDVVGHSGQCKHENEDLRQGDGFTYTVCADCGKELD